MVVNNISWKAMKANDDHLPPMVGSWNSKNSSRTNLTTKHDFPTAESPNNTNLKWHTRFAAAIFLIYFFIECERVDDILIKLNGMMMIPTTIHNDFVWTSLKWKKEGFLKNWGLQIDKRKITKKLHRECSLTVSVRGSTSQQREKKLNPSHKRKYKTPKSPSQRDIFCCGVHSTRFSCVLIEKKKKSDHNRNVSE